MVESQLPRVAIPQRSSSVLSRHSKGDLSLYNGISNRTRGWKVRTTTKCMQVLAGSGRPSISRWDGASRTSEPWDELRKDPELWVRHGNCHIHLYGKGQSRRGPAFKLPFSMLLEAKCQPLIERFIARDGISSVGGTLYSAKQARDQELVELFIPAPTHTDKTQAFNYHIATRNFFAFLCRRSVVGTCLGSALINLMHSMHEFRASDVDNLVDLEAYLDEEGYLDCQNQPSHALAMLRLAETFQLREIYIDALAHCSGMSDSLFLVAEYQNLSSSSRKLIRQVRAETDLRVGRASASLRGFLQEELSESNLGLPAGARAHLGRFRTLLQGFYAAKFGYYPPACADSKSNAFSVDVIRSMTTDFYALYHYLVDQSFDMSRASSFAATGGICALQSVLSFDSQHSFHTLAHPIPLLPIFGPGAESRRTSWYQRPFKPNCAATKTATFVALLNATNHLQADVLDNSLVKAYRRFEEDSVLAPLKADELENLAAIDARKVRWILIYAMHQVLQQLQPAREVRNGDEAAYHTCIPTDDLPPWQEQRPLRALIRRQTSQTFGAATLEPDDLLTPVSRSPRLELKPDIDYLHRDEQSPKDESKGSSSNLADHRVTRRLSLPRSLSRSSTIRRSLVLFSSKSVEKPEKTCNKRASYHEIVVQGYGNGTNPIHFDGKTTPYPPVSVSPVGSESAYSDGNNSDGSSSETSDSSLSSDGPQTPVDNDNWPTIPSTASSHMRRSTSVPHSAPPSSLRNIYPVKQDSSFLPPIPAMKFERRSLSVCHNAPPPLNLRKTLNVRDDGPTLHMPSPTSPTQWKDVQLRMEEQATTVLDYSDCVIRPYDDLDDDVLTEWEQYNDLGGLTECALPAPISRPASRHTSQSRPISRPLSQGLTRQASLRWRMSSNMI